MIIRHCTNMVSVIVSFPGPMFIFPCVSVVYHAILPIRILPDKLRKSRTALELLKLYYGQKTELSENTYIRNKKEKESWTRPAV